MKCEISFTIKTFMNNKDKCTYGYTKEKGSCAFCFSETNYYEKLPNLNRKDMRKRNVYLCNMEDEWFCRSMRRLNLPIDLFEVHHLKILQEI